MLNRMICEAAENHIKVENVAQKAFEVFLGYLYMNPLPELNKQQTLELLSIAHTYEVWVLQETCSDLLEGWLKKNRDFDFVVEVFEIADELLCKKELIAKAYNIVKRWEKISLKRIFFFKLKFYFSKFNVPVYVFKGDTVIKPKKILEVVALNRHILKVIYSESDGEGPPSKKIKINWVWNFYLVSLFWRMLKKYKLEFSNLSEKKIRKTLRFCVSNRRQGLQGT